MSITLFQKIHVASIFFSFVALIVSAVLYNDDMCPREETQYRPVCIKDKKNVKISMSVFGGYLGANAIAATIYILAKKYGKKA